MLFNMMMLCACDTETVTVSAGGQSANVEVGHKTHMVIDKSKDSMVLNIYDINTGAIQDSQVIYNRDGSDISKYELHSNFDPVRQTPYAPIGTDQTAEPVAEGENPMTDGEKPMTEKPTDETKDENKKDDKKDDKKKTTTGKKKMDTKENGVMSNIGMAAVGVSLLSALL